MNFSFCVIFCCVRTFFVSPIIRFIIPSFIRSYSTDKLDLEIGRVDRANVKSSQSIMSTRSRLLAVVQILLNTVSNDHHSNCRYAVVTNADPNSSVTRDTWTAACTSSQMFWPLALDGHRLAVAKNGCVTMQNITRMHPSQTSRPRLHHQGQDQRHPKEMIAQTNY